MYEDIYKTMEYSFGDDFTELVQQYKYLPDIWANCSDPNMMLEMLRKSDYRLDYYNELCEFGRWLHEERRKTERKPPSLDEFLSYNKAHFEREIEAGKLNGERLPQLLWDAAFMYAHVSVNKMFNNAIFDAIFDDTFPKSEAEEPEFRKKTRDRIWKAQAEELRELIDNPFLPNAE
jgi:hypothetical protein